MLKIVPGVLNGNELHRQADSMIGVSHADRLIKRNQLVLFPVGKQQGWIILRHIENGTCRPVQVRFVLLGSVKELYDDFADAVLDLHGTYGEVRYSVVRRRGLDLAGDLLPAGIAVLVPALPASAVNSKYRWCRCAVAVLRNKNVHQQGPSSAGAVLNVGDDSKFPFGCLCRNEKQPEHQAKQAKPH